MRRYDVKQTKVGRGVDKLVRSVATRFAGIAICTSGAILRSCLRRTSVPD